MERAKAGAYYVIADRAGYLQDQIPGMRAFVLKAGQHLTDYKVPMVARARIMGRVVDEFGDPVMAASVAAERGTADENRLGQVSAQTDDRGEFRIVTLPGKYLLKAQLVTFQEREEVRTDGTSDSAFATTYYPSAHDAAAATVVEIAAGQDLAGVEIRMLREAPTAAKHYFTLAGTVMGAPDSGFANVTLRHTENGGYSSFGTQAGADGKFVFPHVEPGAYTLSASYRDSKKRLESRQLPIEVNDDRTGTVLTLQAGEELAGTLEVTGDGPTEKRVVRLELVARAFPEADPPAAEVGKDGRFHLADVLPAKYRLVVDPIPENGFVKEVTLDGQPIADATLDFSQGVTGSRLKITVSRAGGEISGRILDKAGDPAVGAAMVCFSADVQRALEQDAHRVSDGKYLFQGIKPGNIACLRWISPRSPKCLPLAPGTRLYRSCSMRP